MKNDITKGSLTNKGVVEKIVYLTFSEGGWPTGQYSDKPEKQGRGLICAKIGNKNYPVGELTLLTNE